MAFVPGLSKSQVVKVIENYADLAPATMQLITDLSAQINDPLDPAAALIARMVTAESNIGLNESSISTLSSTLSTKAPSDSPTLSNPTLTGTVTLPNASIANSKLINSSISINGTSVSLGGDVTVTGTTLPSQTDNAGKALVTDGSNLSWETIGVDTSALATLTGEETLTNKTLSSPIITTQESTFFTPYSTTNLGASGISQQGYLLKLHTSTYENYGVDVNWTGVNGVRVTDSGTEADGVIFPFEVFSGGYRYFNLGNYYIIDGQQAVVAWAAGATFTLVNTSTKEISSTEIGLLDGLTYNIQDKLTFDTMEIIPELDNVAVMLLSENTINYYQANDSNTAGITVEIAHSMGDGVYNSLNSTMSVGQAVTFVLMIKNGVTTSYPASVTIPYLEAVTVRWQGGTAPTSGNANAVDIYTFTVVKIANNTFEVFADVAKFA